MKEVIHNGKTEIIPELEAEKAANEKKVAQLQHQNERLTNRIRYLNKGDRNRRTHRLCARMGYIEHCAPELQKLTEAEFYDLFEHLLRQPDVKSVIERAVRGHSKGIAPPLDTPPFSSQMVPKQQKRSLSPLLIK